MGLKAKIVKASDFINPLLSKKHVEQVKFSKFELDLNNYLTSITSQHGSNQSEPNIVSNSLKPFFESFGHIAQSFSQKGQSGIDLALMKAQKPTVIIEAKKQNSIDMISINDLYKKSFYEAILYFMREREAGNNSIFHIIITDFFKWFIFDAKEFDKLFWQNNQMKKIYKDYKNPSILGDNTKDFYQNIAKELPKFQATLIDDLEIECAYFNLQDAQNPKDLVAIYKLLSPDTLVKEFNPNDANSLNREFYNELLYIVGLEEMKQGSKKIISQAVNFQSGSLYANISNKLVQYGKSNDFEIIIKLIIIWINRILFLKLLESQIVSWNKNKEFKFLNSAKIADYNKLEMLFFEILAKRPKDRTHKEFDYIPYLNSSLFEIHENETKYLTISTLEDDAKINYYAKTILKDEKKAKKSGQIATLSYLFEFLDAYDFGSTGGEIANESKSLINASVLGLIFEKINGYKDGSFYTPSFITMYMARESLQKSIIEKFNSTFLIEASNFNELKKYCELQSYKDDFSQKANKIIDSLTICDPAVGSGHFLVSALNEIIYIKYQLGLFNLRGLKIELINDELLVKLENEWFEYIKPKDFQSPNHMVQKMLFQEKQRIIENQLFGVDINANSSQITKLRLWIELLKNSYYDTNYELITLPNIDINIKTGNSLISRFDLKDEIKINNIKHEIKNYKQIVKDYKENLGTKKEVLASIESLKNKFRLTLKAEYKVVQERNQKLREYVADFGHEGLNDDLLLTAIKNKYGHVPSLFDDKADTKKQAKLLQELTKLETQIEEIEKGKIYENAFEWRFEFPEVLDEDGNFVGFDIVIGNPPYGVNLSSNDKKYFQNIFKSAKTENGLKGSTDTYSIFIDRGLEILNSGYLNYIVPLAVTSSESMSKLHSMIFEMCERVKISSYFDRPKKIFDDVDHPMSMIELYKNNKPIKQLLTTKINKRYAETSPEEIINKLEFTDSINFRKLGRIPKIGTEIESKILNKLFSLPKKLKDYYENDGEKVYYRTSGGRYYRIITNFSTGSSKENTILVNPKYRDLIGAILSSNLYYWFYQMYSNTLDLKAYELNEFPILLESFTDIEIEAISNIYNEYMYDLEKNSRIINNSFKEYRARFSKHLIDKLDRSIYKGFGLSEKECEFLINYDLVFRTDEE